jgi:hypothetical protein
MHFLLYTLMKDVCKVLGSDSIAKWSIGAISGMGSQITMSDHENIYI